MTKFVLIADSFAGNLTFYFDSKGYLVEFQVNSWNMETDHHEGLLRHLPNLVTDRLFVEWSQKRKYKLNREEIDLSFDRFKIMYGIARDTFKAEPIWKRLSEKEKYFTILNVKAYKRYCKRNVPHGYIQMYPAAYLRNHRQDDWDKVPNWK